MENWVSDPLTEAWIEVAAALYFKLFADPALPNHSRLEPVSDLKRRVDPLNPTRSPLPAAKGHNP